MAQATPQLQSALGTIPADDRAYLAGDAKEVQQAQADSPKQWEHWWWICLGAQVVFLPSVSLMAGHWSPKKADAQAKAHDELVERELAAIAKGEPEPAGQVLHFVRSTTHS
ncbi:hypothetical protein ACW2Q0_24835 [Nocardia sp. R16R-3T]